MGFFNHNHFFSITKYMEIQEILEKPFPLKPHGEVNHPAHYNQSSIECIDAIQAALTPEEFAGFCKGNALKYIWREKGKGGIVDLAKASWYLSRATKTQDS